MKPGKSVIGLILILVSIIQVQGIYDEIITDILDSLGIQVSDSVEDDVVTVPDNSTLTSNY